MPSDKRPQETRIELSLGGGRVSGILLEPEAGARMIVAVAHGAGSGMEHPWLARMCSELVAHGLSTFRFNFPYKEAGRALPDPPARLEATYSEVAHWLCSRRYEHLFLGGKSMGGRIASMIVAKGVPADGLVLLGYPLHPPNKKSSLRSAHLMKLKVPTLFVQGTRDPFCDLTLLEPVLRELGPLATLFRIEGGDHSFGLPRARAREGADAMPVVAEEVHRFCAEVCGNRGTKSSP